MRIAKSNKNASSDISKKDRKQIHASVCACKIDLVRKLIKTVVYSMSYRFLRYLWVIIAVLLSACAAVVDVPEQAETANVIPITDPAGPKIYEIQGAGHISPFRGRYVEGVSGLVTIRTGSGFYMESVTGDNNPATSEGIFVFTNRLPEARPGDRVRVSGIVEEFTPGGSTTANLSITQIRASDVKIVESGNALPPPTLIGNGGRKPPSRIIDDDGLKIFDPDQDGIDFYESLEGMRVQIEKAVAAGPCNEYQEIAVLTDDGSGADLRTPRGGIILREDDANPERIILDDGLKPLPDISTGDRFAAPLVGVMDYSYGNYKVQVTSRLDIAPANLTQESVVAAQGAELSVATYNVENLDAHDTQQRFDTLARHIVENLQSPDLLILEEVQDNSGPQDDGVVAADETYRRIVGAVLALGGPEYQFRDIAPIDGLDGGEEGGNIRVGFLFRTDRGLSFRDVPGGDATTAVEIETRGDKAALSVNPGRIEPMKAAFNESRKPLVGEFVFRGQTIFIIGTHFNSKGGDTPLFGNRQPPARGSEEQRIAQAGLVHDFVKRLLDVDPQALVLIAGDFNDFQWSAPLKTLTGDLLTDLLLELPESERYTYVYEGNAQALDHILVSSELRKRLELVDVVHINAEYAENLRFSDHDPVLARFGFGE